MPTPEATFYVWIPCPKGYTSTELCGRLLDEANVVTTPGLGFGRTADGYIRAALTVETPRLLEAVDRIGKLSLVSSLATEVRMSTLALIGLGSNLGDRRATLEAAADLLGESPGISVRAVSSLHETEAIGGPGGQGAFLNAAAALETSLDPASLLRRLQEIEERLGRVRAVRWGERTLDLDLLLFGDSVIDTPELTVPHLRMAVRRFVLAPLAEIAPDALDPLTRRTVADLLENLDRRPGVIALTRSVSDPLLLERLVQELDAERLLMAISPPSTMASSSLPPDATG